MRSLTLVFVLAVAIAMGSPEPTRVSMAQALANAASKNVERIAIFYYPEGIARTEALDTAGLEALCWGSISIRQFQLSKLRERLLSRLKDSSIESSTVRGGDFRWGCIFYDERDMRLVSLYFTGHGMGRVNETNVTLNDKFVDFLREEFQCVLKSW